MPKPNLNRLLKRLSRRRGGVKFSNNLASAAAISFALTFVSAIVALTLGLVPKVTLHFGTELDSSVVLLMVPMVALLFALVFEVVRTALAGDRAQPMPEASPLMAWSPGRGEG
jgi:putative exporter of polyketide antibiotics